MLQASFSLTVFVPCSQVAMVRDAGAFYGAHRSPYSSLEEATCNLKRKTLNRALSRFHKAQNGCLPMKLSSALCSVFKPSPP